MVLAVEPLHRSDFSIPSLVHAVHEKINETGSDEHCE